MKTNLYIRKNINNDYSIRDITLLNKRPLEADKEYELNKLYPKSEFQYSEFGNIEVQFKGEQVKLVGFADFIKFPEKCKGYKGPSYKTELEEKMFYTANRKALIS